VGYDVVYGHTRGVALALGEVPRKVGGGVAWDVCIGKKREEEEERVEWVVGDVVNVVALAGQYE
jgi:hypothetical protein